MSRSSSGESPEKNRFLVTIVVNFTSPEGIDFGRLEVHPKDSAWNDGKWEYRFEAMLESLEVERVGQEIARWTKALVDAGYGYHQFGVICEAHHQ